MAEAPGRIYLQIGDPDSMLEEEVNDFPDTLMNVTFCDECIYSNDVAYVIAPSAEVQESIKNMLPVLDELGTSMGIKGIFPTVAIQDWLDSLLSA